MPAVSEKQSRAMFAAAGGNSTLGIPKKVGEEFVASDATAGHAAGTLYIAPDGDVLLLRRSSTEKNYAGHWALPGGKGEEGETPEQTADREATEEMGSVPESASRPKLIDSRVTPNKMAFHTFAQPVPEKFVPTLNEEHSGYAWSPFNQLPGPLHPAVESTIKDRLGIEDLETPEDWAMFKIGLVNWLSSEEDDAASAMDSIAMDRDTVRRIDADGHMFVETTPISKANICPYYGKEIPNYKALGLDGERVYHLYRDPKELAKAAQSFAGKPLMLIHKPINSSDHPREVVVGSIGSSVEFKAPYLKAPLNIWDGEAIKLIEANEQKEISCGYRYDADMTPGRANGEAYDGVMRNIEGNHVALVKEGRAGPDVVVGDEAIHSQETNDMASKSIVLSRKASVAHGAILAYLRPKIAQDAKIDVAAVLKDVTAKNYVPATIAADLKKAVTGKLAQDADIEDVIDLLDTLKTVEAAEDDMEPNSGTPAAGKTGVDADPTARLMEILKSKLSDEEMAECQALMSGQSAMDEDNDDDDDEDERKKREAEDEEKKDMVSKGAMDAAIRAAVANERKIGREIDTAKEDVRPYVGSISIACDSAADVYGAALKCLNIDVTGVHPSAFKAILKTQPLPGANPVRQSSVTMDAKAVTSFFDRYPEAKSHQVKTL
jgi:ADP-ribose pyrophosphatase YjhB (NUDIX family)